MKRNILMVCFLFSAVFPLAFSSVLSRQEASSDSVLDGIIEVNTKSGVLAKPNTDGSGESPFEGDIILHSRSRAVAFGENQAIQFGATGYQDELWPNRILYYTMSDDITKEESGITKKAIEAGMKEIKEKTCVTFVKRTKERDYVNFFKGGGCWSMIGRVGGAQDISIGVGCEYKGVVVHEIMHALGFWHEQSRPDRDTYVEIVFDNVIDGYASQFKKYERGEIDSRGSPYDFKSVMHYGPKAFSKNGKDTILVRQKNITVVLGQRLGLSEIDAKQLRQLYTCSEIDCNFEKDFCSWKNKVDDNFDWIRQSGSTPSPYTGPTGDHTKADSLGFYAFIESSSPRSSGHVAKLESETVQSASHPRCFNFWYHMKGSTIGSINVDKQTESSLKTMWTLSGDQAAEWMPARIPIPADTGNFKIAISGITGADWRGDAAIDDISLTDGDCVFHPAEAKPIAPTTKQPTTTAVPTTEKVTTSIPTTEKVTTELPTTKMVTTELPTTEKVTTELPTTKKVTTELPTTEKVTTEEPTIEKVTTEVPTTEMVTTARPTTEMVTTEEPTTEKVTTEEPTTKKVTTELPTTEMVTTEVPTTEERTTTNLPTTIATSFPDEEYICDFESECYYWGNAPGETEWYRYDGRTPSSGTGPTTDHTFGSSKGHYLYLEGSTPRKEGDRARLISTKTVKSEHKCLKFFYFMYGSEIGELNVYLNYGVSGKDILIWSLQEEQGKEWKRAMVPLPSWHSSFKVIIEGVVGSGFQSDIAIDDISYRLVQCESMPPEAGVEVKTTIPPTTIPTTLMPTTQAPENVINVEVISEGCDDPEVVRRASAAGQLGASRSKRDAATEDEDEDTNVDENTGRDFFRRWNRGGRRPQGGGRGRGGKKPKGGRRPWGQEKNRPNKKRPGPRRGGKKGGKQSGKGGEKTPKGKEKKKPTNKKKPKRIKPTKIPRVTKPRRNDCSYAISSIKINGKEYSSQRLGHNVVAISMTTGLPYAQQNFPTHYNFIAGFTMQRFIVKLKPKTIVAIATQGTAHASVYGQEALRMIGVKQPFYPNAKGSWAFIGYKGDGKVDWIQQQTRLAGQGPAKVSARVPQPGEEETKKNVVRRILLKYANFRGDQYLPIPPKYNKILDFGFADFTLSSWIRTTQGGTIVSKTGKGSSLEPYIKLIYVEEGYVKVRLGKYMKASSVKVNNGEWTHIAVAIRAAKRPHRGTMYINGQDAAAFSFDALHDFDDYTVKVGYGVRYFPAKSAFVGEMKQVTYYNAALSKREILDVIRNEKQADVGRDDRGSNKAARDDVSESNDFLRIP